MQGKQLIYDPLLNRGTAFTDEERKTHKLRGLLPPGYETLDQQVERVHANCAAKTSDLERYIFLMALQDQNETLFYRTILSDLDRFMPIIYTPTVGEAAMQYGAIFRRPRGLYITIKDRGSIREILQNWEGKPSVIVATDGGRILGLGDLGANGMSISVGKLALYTSAGGIDPTTTLPVMIDVGTNNDPLLASPHYLGLKQPRTEGAAYFDLLDEFVEAVAEVFPEAMLQFEDFKTELALELLERYRDQLPLFNDDIQGTAAVTLAGVLGALRITGGELQEQKILFVGAGSANTGIADLIASAMVETGMTLPEARKKLWFMDSKGLIVANRDGVKPHVTMYAHEGQHEKTISAAVEALKPTILIGATGQPGIFDQAVVEGMTKANKQCVIFALSNPTSRSEATAEQVYQWSEGSAVFASGSPFSPVAYNKRLHVPGQSNNAYIFPGIGLGVTACKLSRVTDSMFLAAAGAVAKSTPQSALDEGRVFPSLSDIRDVSLSIATAVAEVGFKENLALIDKPADIPSFIADKMYSPEY